MYAKRKQSIYKANEDITGKCADFGQRGVALVSDSLNRGNGTINAILNYIVAELALANKNKKEITADFKMKHLAEQTSGKNNEELMKLIN